MLVVTTVLDARDDRFTETTRDYELVAPAAGTYFFYCDPHVDADAAAPSSSPTRPRRPRMCRWSPSPTHGDRFDKKQLELVAGRTTVIRFTNTDGTAHNVSIYRDRAARDDVFVGSLFSGKDLATFTFRVFRIVFVIIPLALFVAILRFHLWDVQRLANRAMVYSVLTGCSGSSTPEAPSSSPSCPGGLRPR